jgi:hypothetical protein
MQKRSWNVPSLNVYELIRPTPGSENVDLKRGQAIWPNSDEPVEFENEFFVGRVLFMMKTDPRHPKWHQLFMGRRRLFWFQLQGQFKRQPKGTVYIGGEVPRKMNLGVFSSAMCRVILGVINVLTKGLHYGLGEMYPQDVSAKDEEELPHLCFPLHSSVDEFICTPAGEIPPTLGQDTFGESRADKAARKSLRDPYQFNVRDTYTFSFFSYFLDFENWSVVNIPGMPNMPLEKFWDDMPLRIVAYTARSSSSLSSSALSSSGDDDEIVSTMKKDKNIRHTQDQKHYYVSLELSPATGRQTRN